MAKISDPARTYMCADGGKVVYLPKTAARSDGAFCVMDCQTAQMTAGLAEMYVSGLLRDTPVSVVTGQFMKGQDLTLEQLFEQVSRVSQLCSTAIFSDGRSQNRTFSSPLSGETSLRRRALVSQQTRQSSKETNQITPDFFVEKSRLIPSESALLDLLNVLLKQGVSFRPEFANDLSKEAIRNSIQRLVQLTKTKMKKVGRSRRKSMRPSVFASLIAMQDCNQAEMVCPANVDISAGLECLKTFAPDVLDCVAEWNRVNGAAGQALWSAEGYAQVGWSPFEMEANYMLPRKPELNRGEAHDAQLTHAAVVSACATFISLIFDTSAELTDFGAFSFNGSVDDFLVGTLEVARMVQSTETRVYPYEIEEDFQLGQELALIVMREATLSPGVAANHGGPNSLVDLATG